MSSRNMMIRMTSFLALLGIFVLAASIVYAQCGAGCAGAGCAKKAKAAPAKVEPSDIDTPALKALISAKVPMALLDARGRRKSWIPGAVSLPVSVKDADILKAVPSKDTLVVTYCGSLRCPLSAMLGKRMRDLGYKNVLEYRKGIKGWTDSGGNVESADG